MLTCTFEDKANTTDLRHAVVDILVIQDEKILLVKRSEKLSLEAGKWALTGGFVNRGETIKQAAIREAKEETGYQITNLHLLTIRDNPDRPHEDRQNIAFVYISEAFEKVGEPDWEVSEVKWFSLNALPPKETIAFDHYEDIRLYMQYKQRKKLPPVIT